MTRQLIVFLGDDRIGTLECDVRASTFRYDADYLARRAPTPLSLSIPVTPGVHETSVVNPFLWGLLPDNPDTLRRWALLAQPHADEYNPFSLLEHYGRDCAGAVQFLAPTDSDEVGQPGPTQWLTDEQIGHQLGLARNDPTAWTFDDAGGRFSLAGAQAKFALARIGGRWGRPSGATATTHIFKPGIPGYRASALNEHMCLTIARSIGVAAARSSIESFDGESAIVVERFDRIVTDDSVLRIHQEDFCQALGVHPSQKYQDDGGPGIIRISHTFREHQRSGEADASIRRYLDGVAFNWLIGAPDAHAKNYSILLRGGQIALAPLYDIATITPYPRYRESTARLAQSVDGEYRLSAIGAAQWRAQARRVGLDGAAIVDRVRELAERIPEAVSHACAEASVRAIDLIFVRDFQRAVIERVRTAGAALARG